MEEKKTLTFDRENTSDKLYNIDEANLEELYAIKNIAENMSKKILQKKINVTETDPQKITHEFWTKDIIQNGNNPLYKYTKYDEYGNNIISLNHVSDPIEEIEKAIKKQNKGKELINLIKKEQSLSSENIIFFIENIKKYIDCINKEELYSEIDRLNKQSIDNEYEFNLINKFKPILNNISYRNAPDTAWEEYDNFWEEISNYNNALIEQKNSSRR